MEDEKTKQRDCRSTAVRQHAKTVLYMLVERIAVGCRAGSGGGRYVNRLQVLIFTLVELNTGPPPICQRHGRSSVSRAETLFLSIELLRR